MGQALPWSKMMMNNGGRQSYRSHIRMAYHISNDGLRISLPDKYCFSANLAHIHFRDQKHVVVAQDKSRDTTWTCPLSRSDTTPGSRYVVIPGVKRIGSHFGMCNVNFIVEGPNFVLSIPDEADRRPPKRQRIAGAKVSGNGLAKTEATGDVIVDVLGQSLSFAVPTTELFAQILEWQGKGYAT